MVDQTVLIARHKYHQRVCVYVLYCILYVQLAHVVVCFLLYVPLQLEKHTWKQTRYQTVRNIPRRVVFCHLLAQALQTLKRRISHNYFSLPVFQGARRPHTPPPKDHSKIFLLQKIYHRSYFFGLPQPQSNVIILLIFSAAEKIETAKGKLTGKVL